MAAWATEENDSIEVEKTAFETIISDNGGIIRDLSGDSCINIAEPAIGYLNISGFKRMPVSKENDYRGLMEYYDETGNYFKKAIVCAVSILSTAGL